MAVTVVVLISSTLIIGNKKAGSDVSEVNESEGKA